MCLIINVLLVARWEGDYKGISILITFDDGFKSAYLASHIMDKYNVKGVFFVPTEFIDCENREQEKQFIINDLLLTEEDLTDQMKPMSWENVKEMHRKGHSIGAHTLSHARVSTIKDDDKLKYELYNSKIILENILEHKICCFAYPFGNLESINEKSLSMSQEFYYIIFSAIRGFNSQNTNPIAIRRDGVLAEYNLNYLRFIIEGGLDIKYMQARKRLDQLAFKICYQPYVWEYTIYNGDTPCYTLSDSTFDYLEWSPTETGNYTIVAVSYTHLVTVTT